MMAEVRQRLFMSPEVEVAQPCQLMGQHLYVRVCGGGQGLRLGQCITNAPELKALVDLVDLGMLWSVRHGPLLAWL